MPREPFCLPLRALCTAHWLGLYSSRVKLETEVPLTQSLSEGGLESPAVLEQLECGVSFLSSNTRAQKLCLQRPIDSSSWVYVGHKPSSIDQRGFKGTNLHKRRSGL